jgi:cytochrome c553
MKRFLFLPLVAALTCQGQEASKKEVFWSFRQPVNILPPAVKEASWPLSMVDRYVLAAQEKNGLSPAKPAEARVLVRRLFFALCGLPPSAEVVEHWQREIGPDLNQTAIAALVDSLLRSPRFGEHWGQHWLDVARFAESTGGDANGIHPYAWRYRDYVIDSLNADKAFDRFIREQIAGDLLPISSDQEWAQNLVATGFLAVGQKLVGEVEDRKFHADLVDEQIDATTRAFLGLTAACARCHDHKTDPIPQADYYALAAIFRNTETHYGLIKAQSRQYSTLLDVTGMGLSAGRDALTAQQLAEMKAEQEAAAQKMDDIMRTIRGGDGVTRAMLRRSRTQRDQSEALMQSYDAQGNPLTFIMGVQDRDAPLETRILERGELDKPGALVSAGFLRALHPGSTPPTLRLREGSGRLQLADWLASPRNPLTARVIANRIWHWLFGQGLVRTVDDFGATGDKPTHPELLDHLALRLIEQKWSLKALIRELVLTRTWQQASTFDAEKFARDPDNVFLWRMSPRRLEAEAVRDAMLAVSGKLDLTRPAKPLIAAAGEGTLGQAVFEPEIRKIAAPVRSVYLPRVRSVLPEMMELYDAPDASNVMGARETTTVPLQALHALNSAFVREQAEAFADRLSKLTVFEQLDHAWLSAFGRPPTTKERELANAFTFELEAQNQASTSREAALIAFAHSLLCAAEFTVID